MAGTTLTEQLATADGTIGWTVTQVGEPLAVPALGVDAHHIGDEPFGLLLRGLWLTRTAWLILRRSHSSPPEGRLLYYPLGAKG